MKVNFNLKKEYVYGIIGLLILATGFFVVNAYGTSNPAVFGHSAGEIEGGGGTLSIVRVDNTKYFRCGQTTSVEVSCPTGTVLIDCGVKNVDSQRRITDTAAIGIILPTGQYHQWWVDRGTDADANANYCRYRATTTYPVFCNEDWTISAYCLKIE